MGEDQEGAEPGVESVNCHEGLVRLLAEQFARADVSLLELQARADRTGGPRLPRATCADMLAGCRFPRKAVMVTFLRACGVPERQVPEWERAWERVRIARMPPTGFQLTRTALSPTIPPLEDPRLPAPAPLGHPSQPYTALLEDLTEPGTAPPGGPGRSTAPLGRPDQSATPPGGSGRPTAQPTDGPALPGGETLTSCLEALP
ncbi:hypothetical protein [Nonomuraea sp. NPDC052265]|uniref:hypothetical protein n=1 Tax=Nonomuraea sp. NPDC052265 TaxID=3364374 RepID=UPI0037CC6E47